MTADPRRWENGDLDDDRQPDPPAAVRSEEGRAIVRLVQRLGTTMARGFEQQRQDMRNLRAGIGLELDSRLGPAKPASLPPVREPSPSQVNFVEQTTRKVEARLVERAKETPGPNVNAPPGELAKLVEGVVAEAFVERDKASALKTVDQLRKLRWVAIAAFVGAIGTGAGGLLWGKTQGHLEERAKSAAHGP